MKVGDHSHPGRLNPRIFQISFLKWVHSTRILGERLGVDSNGLRRNVAEGNTSPTI